jgi:hypothetical protein
MPFASMGFLEVRTARSGDAADRKIPAHPADRLQLETSPAGDDKPAAFIPRSARRG